MRERNEYAGSVVSKNKEGNEKEDETYLDHVKKERNEGMIGRHEEMDWTPEEGKTAKKRSDKFSFYQKKEVHQELWLSH